MEGSPVSSFRQQMEDEAPKGFKLPPPARLRHYGLTAEQYRELWGDGFCPICLKPFGPGPRTACIDHDHRTWEVRGVLDTSCNYTLGYMHDNADWFQRAANYLLHPPTELWTPRPRLEDAPPRQGD